jgi:hypothetical protein
MNSNARHSTAVQRNAWQRSASQRSSGYPFAGAGLPSLFGLKGSARQRSAAQRSAAHGKNPRVTRSQERASRVFLDSRAVHCIAPQCNASQRSAWQRSSGRRFARVGLPSLFGLKGTASQGAAMQRNASQSKAKILGSPIRKSGPPESFWTQGHRSAWQCSAGHGTAKILGSPIRKSGPPESFWTRSVGKPRPLH